MEAAIEAVQRATTKRSRIDAQVNGIQPIAQHVATPTGEQEVMLMRDHAESTDDLVLAYYLDSCLNVGREMRRTYESIQAQVVPSTDRPAPIRHVASEERPARLTSDSATGPTGTEFLSDAEPTPR